MQGHPEERLLLERLRTLIDTRLGSVSVLEERLGLAPGALDELRPDAAPPQSPLSLRWLYRILDILGIEPREFFSQVYELAPRAPLSTAGISGGIAEPEGSEFPPFGRVLDTVRLLVRDAEDQQGPDGSEEEKNGEALNGEEAPEPPARR
ncbi:MAG TPA: hypothetical protein VEL74_08740 [Thermoanaerobaculia bacterium]|nr:hypothetical protein [Thermoanaerobaculia bacterium]